MVTPMPVQMLAMYLGWRYGEIWGRYGEIWGRYGETWGRYRGDGGARPDAGDVPAVGGGWVKVLE